MANSKLSLLKIKYFTSIILLFIFILPFSKVFPQNTIPNNPYFTNNYEAYSDKNSTYFITPIKPINDLHSFQTDSINTQNIFFVNKYKKTNKKIIPRKLFYEDLITISEDNFHLIINPVVNGTFEKSNEEIKAVKNDENNIVNSRGFYIRGFIGEKFGFTSYLVETQASFSSYIDSSIYHSKVVPGEGFANVFKTKSYDFPVAQGNLFYKPFNFLEINFGHGKNFIGDGYRSLILSDAAFNYPYLKYAFQYKQFQYTVMYAAFQDINYPHSYEAGYLKKYYTLHALSTKLFNRLHLSIYESTIWNPIKNGKAGNIEAKYFNPLIGIETTSYGLSDKNNVLLGSTFKFDFTKNITIYGQYVIDNLQKFNKNSDSLNKTAFQLGFKLNNLFSKNIFALFEFNSIDDLTYTHFNSNNLSSYSHYNDALASPTGNGSTELIAKLAYYYKRLIVEADFVNAQSMNNYNLYSNRSFFQYADVNKLNSTVERKYNFSKYHFAVGYIINPRWHLVAKAGISIIKTEDYKNNAAYISLSTPLFNHYNDFR